MKGLGSAAVAMERLPAADRELAVDLASEIARDLFDFEAPAQVCGLAAGYHWCASCSSWDSKP